MSEASSDYIKVINFHARMADTLIEKVTVDDGFETAALGYLEVIAHALTALAVRAVSEEDE